MCFVNTTYGERKPTVADDIVTRLRELQQECRTKWLDGTVGWLWTEAGDAADEIERLRYVVDRLNAALDDISHLTADHNVRHRIDEARRT
jgi:hypothetical protein